MVGFSTDKSRTALVSRKKFFAENSNGGVGHHGDDGHGMHFSQPNVTKIFRGSWLISDNLSAVCHLLYSSPLILSRRI